MPKRTIFFKLSACCTEFEEQRDHSRCRLGGMLRLRGGGPASDDGGSCNGSSEGDWETDGDISGCEDFGYDSTSTGSGYSSNEDEEDCTTQLADEMAMSQRTRLFYGVTLAEYPCYESFTHSFVKSYNQRAVSDAVFKDHAFYKNMRVYANMYNIRNLNLSRAGDEWDRSSHCDINLVYFQKLQWRIKHSYRFDAAQRTNTWHLEGRSLDDSCIHEDRSALYPDSITRPVRDSLSEFLFVMWPQMWETFKTRAHSLWRPQESWWESRIRVVKEEQGRIVAAARNARFRKRGTGGRGNAKANANAKVRAAAAFNTDSARKQRGGGSHPLQGVKRVNPVVAVVRASDKRSKTSNSSSVHTVRSEDITIDVSEEGQQPMDIQEDV